MLSKKLKYIALALLPMVLSDFFRHILVRMFSLIYSIGLVLNNISTAENLDVIRYELSISSKNLLYTFWIIQQSLATNIILSITKII